MDDEGGLGFLRFVDRAVLSSCFFEGEKEFDWEILDRIFKKEKKLSRRIVKSIMRFEPRSYGLDRISLTVN